VGSKNASQLAMRSEVGSCVILQSIIIESLQHICNLLLKSEAQQNSGFIGL